MIGGALSGIASIVFNSTSHSNKDCFKHLTIYGV